MLVGWLVGAITDYDSKVHTKMYHKKNNGQVWFAVAFVFKIPRQAKMETVNYDHVS